MTIIKSLLTDKEFILRTVLLPVQLFGIFLTSIIVGIGLVIGGIIGLQIGLYLIPM